MNNFNDRISRETAADVFALAAQLQTQRYQDYSSAELMQAGAEADISPEILQEALKLMQAKQIQDQTRRQKLRLMFTSGAVGAAIALGGVGAYTALTRNPAWNGNSPLVSAVQTNPSNSNTAGTPLPAPPDSYAATFTGTVEQYLLNPEGRVDGLLLKNGLQVKFPPHLGMSLATLVTPGNDITVTGIAGVPTRFGQEIRASQITNRQTQQTVTKQESPDSPPSPPATLSHYNSLSAEGTAQHWLVGHRGEIHGVVLSSGTQVKFPPHVGDQLISTAQVGDKVQVQGFGSRNNDGQVIEATTLTVNGRSVAIAPPVPKP